MLLSRFPRTLGLRHSLLLLAVLALFGFSASCAREEVQPAGDAAELARVEALSQARDSLLSQKASLEATATKWTLDETSSDITGFYEGEVLRVIEEAMDMGEFGTSTSVYFYTPKGGLFAYSEEKQSRTGVRTGNPKTERVELSLLFSDNGSLLRGERKVDGATTELTGLEAQGVRMHARELELMLQSRRQGGTP